MKRLIAILALLFATPALAAPVYTYPSAGTPPAVILQCDSAQANCSPTSAANPMPTGIADVSASGSLTALNQAVTLTGLNGKAAGLIQLSGTWTGSVQLEGSNDSFVTTTTLSTTQSGGAAPSTTAISANGDYRVLGTVNYASIRARVSAFTSGTIVVNLKMSDAIGITPVISTNAAGFLATVTGNVAAGTADSGSPVKIGGLVLAQTGKPTLTAGNRADATFDTNGNLAVVAGGQYNSGMTGQTAAYMITVAANNGGFSAQQGVVAFNYNGTTIDATKGDVNGTVVQPGLGQWTYTSGTTGILSNTTTAVTFKAAAGAAVRNFVDSCQITTTAFTVSVPLAIRDGAAGTVIWAVQVPTSGFLTPVVISFPAPLRSTANTLLEVVTTTANTAGTVVINCQGHTGT